MKNQSVFWILLLLIIACQTPDKNTTANTIAKEAVVPKKMNLPIAKYEMDRTEDAYRNENWQPENGNYFFSEVWTWSFWNEQLPTDDPNHKGTFSVYVDPPTGTMLLSEHLDEMSDWIIIHPNGQYTTAFTDGHGKPYIVNQQMADFEEHDFKLSFQKEDFKKYVTQQAGTKEFGENKYGWKTINATFFQMTFEKTNDVVQLHLLQMPFSVRGLYLAAKTNQDLRLPLNLDYGYLLPADYLVISEAYEFGDKKVGFALKSVSPGEYFVNTATYPANH